MEADSLFSQGEYLSARVAYERLIFNGYPDTNSLLLKKSYCLKAEGKFEEAYNTLLSADFFQEPDSLKTKLYYESVLNSFLMGKYDLSYNKIQELHNYLPAVSMPMIDLLEILNLNNQHKLKEAEEKFKQFVSKYQLSDQMDIYRQKKFTKLRNPEKAESISHFLPGIGQWYAGYPVRGITSGLIQTGLLTFTAYSFLNGYYFGGAFTGMGTFYKFNNGGARHAHYLAEKKNRKTIDRLNEEIKKIGAAAIRKKV
ncbi:MAG TPA: hypothetical protein DGG95_14790 [Cytophagales bacterium]|nr:hypothetical protein [Cytophagales bacterium]